MRSAVVGLVLALVFFVAGAVCWLEAGVSRSVADAHERLDTLKYDPEDGIDMDSSVLARIPWAGPLSLAEDVKNHRATVTYWRSGYRELIAANPLSGGNATGVPPDPDVMFITANASFRSTISDMTDKIATVDRLDRVMQAYADILRAQPSYSDASYNYEYVARFRDTFAKSKGTRVPSKPARTDGGVDESVDLPIGPTLHGRPGGPPQDLPMQNFRTVTPMRFEEREELEPGRGPRPRRRG